MDISNLDILTHKINRESIRINTMKPTNLVIDINPKFFGENANELNVESFAFNINKNVEKAFNIKCDYTTKFDNKNYQITSSDPALEMVISEFIENNWNHVFAS